MDLYDLEHNVRDGIHIASLAGAWTALVMGLAVCAYKATLSFAPRLPEGITRLAFHFGFLGCRLRIEVTAKEATYHLLDDPPLTMRHHGEEFHLTVNEATTLPIPPIKAGPLPRQPPGREPMARGRQRRAKK